MSILIILPVQDVLTIKEILEDARVPAAMPVQLWENDDFLTDHEFQNMDEQELQDFFESSRNVPVAIAT